MLSKEVHLHAQGGISGLQIAAHSLLTAHNEHLQNAQPCAEHRRKKEENKFAPGNQVF